MHAENECKKILVFFRKNQREFFMILNWAIKSTFLYKVKDFWTLSRYSIFIMQFSFYCGIPINWIFDINILKSSIQIKSQIYIRSICDPVHSAQKKKIILGAQIRIEKKIQRIPKLPNPKLKCVTLSLTSWKGQRKSIGMRTCAFEASAMLRWHFPIAPSPCSTQYNIKLITQCTHVCSICVCGEFEKDQIRHWNVVDIFRWFR